MPKEEKQRTKKAKSETPAAMFDQVKTIDTSGPVSTGGKSIWKAVAPIARKLDVEQRYIPNLPSPPPMAQLKRISFNKPVEEVRLIAEYLFDDPDCPASTVGEACFEEILNQAQDD